MPRNQRGEPGHLRGIALQVERQAVLREQRKTRPPLRVLRHVARRVAAQRIGVPVDDVADAANARVRRLLREQRFDLGIVQLRERDDRARQAARVGDAFEPFGLVERLRRIRPGVDMHRADDIPPRHVGKVVGERVVLGDRFDRAVGPVLRKRRRQPRIADPAELPQMDVRIDERDGHEASPAEQGRAVVFRTVAAIWAIRKSCDRPTCRRSPPW